jgi:hypothetical protein
MKRDRKRNMSYIGDLPACLLRLARWIERRMHPQVVSFGGWTQIEATDQGWRWDDDFNLIHESDQRSNRWPYGYEKSQPVYDQDGIDENKWSAFVGMTSKSDTHAVKKTPGV